MVMTTTAGSIAAPRSPTIQPISLRAPNPKGKDSANSSTMLAPWVLKTAVPIKRTIMAATNQKTTPMETQTATLETVMGT